MGGLRVDKVSVENEFEDAGDGDRDEDREEDEEPVIHVDTRQFILNSS